MPTKLSQLPPAGTLSGDEIIPLVQGARTSQTTARQIADLNPARVESVAGKTGAVTLTKSDVGLGNVDNTSDLNKPVSTATQAKFDALQAEFDALPVFASAAENAAGTVEGKMVDPLGIREAFNATGSAPVYACRAWVNFNGTVPMTIRASGNVSSITDNGTGDYTVNFATALPDANFSVSGFSTSGASDDQSAVCAWETDSQTTAAVRVRVINHADSSIDSSRVCVQVFR